MIPVVVEEKVVVFVDATVVDIVLSWCNCGLFSQWGSNNVSGTLSITSLNLKIVV